MSEYQIRLRDSMFPGRNIMSQSPVRLRNSIATQYLKIVFGLYFIVVVVLTGIQLITEYRHVKETISEEIQRLPAVFGPGIVRSLWNFSDVGLHSILIGMMEIPTIVGVKVEGEDGEIIQSIGTIITQDGSKISTDIDGNLIPFYKNKGLFAELFQYEFPLLNEVNGEIERIGTGTIYSSTSIVIQRVKYGFILILISAIIKTLALWIIFLFFGRMILGRPLEQLTTAVDGLPLDNLENSDGKRWKVNLNIFGKTNHPPKQRNQNELEILENAFNRMTDKLFQTIFELEKSKAQLHLLNEELEERVNQRTADLNEALENLHKTQNQLIVQEKLASMGALTAGIAHEIKNPINLVNNFAEISTDLLEELQDKQKKSKINLKDKDTSEVFQMLKRSLTKIEKNGKRADRIVEGMLMHAKGNKGKHQLTDINQLLQTLLEIAYPSMRAKDKTININIESAFDQHLEKINVIPEDLSRVFVNMMNNAFYAAHQKSKENDPEFSPMVKVRTNNLGNRIEIRIFDNGNGIPKKNLDKIFEPFFTTKPPGEGTGLGLSLSYDIIVQGHHGSIQVESKEGHFTEFIVTLPK